MTNATVPGVLLTGDHASRPAASVGDGVLYSCTDHSKVYQSDGSTWTDWFDPSAVAGNALSRTLIYRATGQTITGSGTQTIVSFSNETDDDAGVWAIGTPTKLVIPAGLNGRKGRVYGQITFTGSSSGTYRRARILKGGSEVATMTVGVPGTTAAHLQVVTPVVSFATSEEFELAFNADVAGLTTIGGAAAVFFGLYTVD